MARINSVKASMRTATTTMTRDQVSDLIRKKAFELYEKRGRKSGKALSDWLEAERIVKANMM